LFSTEDINTYRTQQDPKKQPFEFGEFD